MLASLPQDISVSFFGHKFIGNNKGKLHLGSFLARIVCASPENRILRENHGETCLLCITAFSRSNTLPQNCVYLLFCLHQRAAHVFTHNFLLSSFEYAVIKEEEDTRSQGKHKQWPVLVNVLLMKYSAY